MGIFSFLKPPKTPTRPGRSRGDASAIHTSHLTYGDYTIVVLRKSQAKRLTLRVSKRHRGLVLVAPQGCLDTHILSFLRSCDGWLRKVAPQILALQKTTGGTSHQPICSTSVIAPGQRLSILGSPTVIRYISCARRSVQLQRDTEANQTLDVYGPSLDILDTQVRCYIKSLALDKVTFYSHRYAQTLGVTFNAIRVKSMTSRHGSCSSRGNLNYGWHLAFAPEWILAYVCAHEVAHLKEMNHSRAFWAIVAQLYPTYRQAIKWLKINGSTLQI